MPEAPVTSDDQKASKSWPMGVTTPAAAITTRSGVATGRAPGVVEVEPLGGVGADHTLERGHHGGEAALLLARLDPDRRIDLEPVAAARRHHAEGGDHRRADRAREH